MKKNLFIPAAICCAIMACGCSGTSSRSSDSKGGTLLAKDAPSSLPMLNAAPEDHMIDPYTMPDGKIFDLKGSVKRCVVSGFYSDELGNPTGTKPEDETTLEFGPDGKIAKHSEYEKFVRGDKGELLKMTWFCGDFGMDFEDQFTCNSDGFPISEKMINLSGQDWQYEYSQDNVLLKATSTATYEEGMEGKTETTYKILESDSHGNWTKRLLNVKDGQREMGASDYQWNTYDWVEIRKIEY